MKILQINTVCGRGSTGRIVLDIHKTLLQMGYESYVAYGRPPAISCPEAIRIGSKLDLYSHVLLTRLFDLHGFGSKRPTIKFLKKVEQIDSDIIHLHNVHGYYINVELLFNYLKESSRPVVWTLHDCWPFTGHCTHFNYVGCEKWKAGCFKCPQKKRYPASYFLDNSEKNYEMKKQLFTGLKRMIIVTPSRWLANLVKESFLKEYPVEVIPNGIDTNLFKPTPGDFRRRYNLEGKFVILGVANVWEERKGLKYFFEFSKLLREDEIIVLVGLNKKQIEILPKNIIGIPKTNSPVELAQIYSSADVFLNPTLEENYPTVNLEAQACGSYVITFDSGGCRETILEEHVTGEVVERMINLCSMRTLIDRIREKTSLDTRARKILDREKLSFHRPLEAYLNLYKGVI
jgi:glycosyltransferase involved in cell wall biosynthesis